MTSPHRFTPFEPLSREGSLLAAGRAEVPESAALRRVARHIGVSATVLGVASATSVASAASSMTASSTAAVTGTAPAAVSTLFSATFLKAIVVGVGIGASTLGAVELVRERAPVVVKRPYTVVVTQKGAIARAATSQAILPEEPEVAPLAETTAMTARPARSAVQPAVSTPVVSAAQTQATVARGAEGHAAPVPTAEAALPLAREVASLDRARTAVSRGDAAMALRELDEFERSDSYHDLGREVMLVRIEALLVMGHREEAAAIARRLLQLGAPATQRARLEQLCRTQP